MEHNKSLGILCVIDTAIAAILGAISVAVSSAAVIEVIGGEAWEGAVLGVIGGAAGGMIASAFVSENWKKLK